jgi:hypothetical protein
MIERGKGLFKGSFFIFRQFMNFFISKMQHSNKNPPIHIKPFFIQIISTGNKTDKSEK